MQPHRRTVTAAHGSRARGFRSHRRNIRCGITQTGHFRVAGGIFATVSCLFWQTWGALRESKGFISHFSFSVFNGKASLSVNKPGWRLNYGVWHLEKKRDKQKQRGVSIPSDICEITCVAVSNCCYSKVLFNLILNNKKPPGDSQC